MARFDGKVALITGAASGIGQAVSVRLASEGAKVFAIDINGDGLAVTADRAGSGVTPHVADVSNRASCQAIVAACVDALGGLDVLGNVAGIARAHHVPDVTEDEWNLLLAVNVSGPFWLAQAAIPHLLERSGNIVNIASNAGLMGQAYTVPYCVTKGAVVQLTRALAMEYVKRPLRVNAIAPGGVDTALAQNFEIPAEVDYDLMMRYTGFRPMAQAEDIAAMFAYVASDEARNVHGSILSNDAGITAG